jgi:hypothetical protein
MAFVFRLTLWVPRANVRLSMTTAETNYTPMGAVAIKTALGYRVASWHAATKQEEFI